MDRKIDLESFHQTLAKASMEQSPYAKMSIEEITSRAVNNLRAAMDQVRSEHSKTDR